MLFWTACLLIAHLASGEQEHQSAWPQLELFLPVHVMPGPRKGIFNDLFLRSLKLFWPLQQSKITLRILLDEEAKAHPEYKYFLDCIDAFKPHVKAGLHINYNQPLRINGGLEGHDRQQLLMFWADNYTTSEYVGFVDIDSVFITNVDVGDLFENGKPVVNARTGPEPNDKYFGFWGHVPESTEKLFGFPEPMRCMSYFPVIIKTKHLKEIRDYFVNKHNQYFDYIFSTRIRAPHYSQFNIMCAYLYTYHRDEYQWYVHPTKPDWDGKIPPGSKGQNTNMSIFTKEMFYPKPRIAIHSHYRLGQNDIESNVNNLNRLFTYGICYSPPFPRNEGFCKTIDPKVPWNEMHTFEGFDWTKVVPKEELDKAMLDRYERIKHNKNTLNHDEVKKLLN